MCCWWLILWAFVWSAVWHSWQLFVVVSLGWDLCWLKPNFEVYTFWFSFITQPSRGKTFYPQTYFCDHTMLLSCLQLSHCKEEWYDSQQLFAQTNRYICKCMRRFSYCYTCWQNDLNVNIVEEWIFGVWSSKISNLDPCNASVLYQLSYQAKWELVIMWFNLYNLYDLTLVGRIQAFLAGT